MLKMSKMLKISRMSKISEISKILKNYEKCQKNVKKCRKNVEKCRNCENVKVRECESERLGDEPFFFNKTRLLPPLSLGVVQLGLVQMGVDP